MRARLLTVPVLLALGLACQSSPPPAAGVPATPAERADAFEAQRAWQDLGELAEIGPRVMGTEGARRAGDYILGELTKLELEIIEQDITVRRGEEDAEPLALRNIAAKIPGRSSDIFLLVAPYDTRRYESFRFLGVNDGGSGSALLLEIARVLAADPLPYTTWLVFLDGEAPLAPGSVPVASPSHFGSRALAKQLYDEGVIAGVRLALILNRVCDADLRVARDLLSHRIYREEFWRAAARLGRSDAFPPGASFESPVASHHALAAVGLRRVVALVDTSFGGDEPPGLYAGTQDDDLEHCSADSLEAVGKVSLEALDKISQRLAKIDRFSASPLEGPGELTFELPAAPEADAPATPQAGDDAASPSTPEGGEERTEATPEGPPANPEAAPATPAAPEAPR
ncbi:MAG: M28 family peptidase [Deltaproteobacteria bacterium]|nr:M28 family peptidase [Deltaproteobacteria bacterium]